MLSGFYRNQNALYEDNNFVDLILIFKMKQKIKVKPYLS